MEIKSTETTIANVLDLYYSWLVKMMGPNGSDRVALFSSIVTEDIFKDAPLYTEGVFRGFVDRTISVSPENFGPGNTTDRYSRRYKDLISLAAYELYSNAKFTDQQLVQLQKLQGDITQAIQDINTTRQQATRDWNSYAAENGLQPNTPKYDLERANFLLPYASAFREYRQRITTADATKLAIRMSVFKNDREAAQLCRVYERCLALENIQPLPIDPTVERIYGLDPIKIGEAAEMGLYAFESELGIDASGSLVAMLDGQGSRAVSFAENQQEQHNHDREWHISGGASSWIPCFSADVSGTEESHFRQSIKNIESISISCDHLAEYWVRRRDWFDSTIFANKYVAEQLKMQPQTAAVLALCVSSVVIVRGLHVKYKFKHVDDTTVWSSWSANASGGFSAWGCDFHMNGGASGSDYSHVVNKDDRSVTFSDGPTVCRLIALRASNLIPSVPSQAIAFATRRLAESEIGLQLIDAWSKGTAQYGVMPREIAKVLDPSDSATWLPLAKE